MITVGSTIRIPLLYRGEYSQWRERFMNYLEEKTNGEAMINSIQNGDHTLPVVAHVSLAETAPNAPPTLKDPKFWTAEEKKTRKIDRLARSLLIQGLMNDIYSLIDSNDTAKDLWDALERHMRGSEYGEKDRKATILYEYETFKATEGEYDVNDALGYKKKAFMVTSDPLALVAAKTKKYYAKPTNNNMRTSSASSSANKKPEYVKSVEKKEDKKADEKKKTIAKVAYYTSESESESEYETSKYYDNSTNYGLLVNDDDDQEIFHDAIESASENFKENHIVSQKECDESEVDHNDSEENDHLVDKLIQKFNHKIAKCHKRIKKANQQSKDLENQNKDLRDKYDVLINQVNTFEEKSNEFKEQMKVLNEKNADLLAQIEVLQKQLKVKHVVIDTHTKGQVQYAKLEEERYEYMIRYSALCDNDKQHRKKIDEQEILFDNMSRFENPSYFGKAKDLRPSLYDERVIGLGYPLLFLTHSNEALEIERYRHLSSVRRPKHSSVIWKKKGSSNTSNDDLFYVSHSKLNKDVKRYSRKDLLSCNNSHLGDMRSDYACNDAMNVSCNSSLYASYDENDLFIFDDVSVRNSQVSKMTFRIKPHDYLNVHSKSNSNKSLPRTVHRWLPKMQPLAEPIAKWIPKHMTGNRALLTNFVEKFLGTVRFGNNDFAVIASFGDVGLEVAFRKSTCFVQNEDGVDLLTGNRSSNLYIIALNEVASNSSACLLAKASSSQSWLWHQRLSHLNFATINNLVKNNLVQGLPKMKFEKDHLCSTCEQGKIHRKHHKSKTVFASNKPLYLLHMDLCDRCKTQVNLQLQVQRVRTDNGTEFKNKTLAKFFDEVGISQQFSAVRTLQQNSAVERRNRALVEAARTMLTFAKLPLFV
uniref:Integrase catalytic domain-containing protein n=1 Tax=Tanacetum cinerariifolium TaxID=118510 RepID=A0A6L2K0M2_TANCI|nr:hypothetical protein [Tanacetum cinerariifolium]